ncbi:MAG: peroxiredoxin family protein [Planctomycetes bacterium]|nr:peroxiredoxin family protein [Planctomycetota bacterium]
MRALPSHQKLWNEFKGRGLSLFLVEVQENTFEDIAALAKKHSVDMPMPLRFESDFTNYVKLEDGTTLPYAYIISPEGKVVWQGKKGYEAVVEKQLARLTYKTLRRVKVDPLVAPAAQLFEDAQYAKAHKAASKVLKKNEEGTVAWQDATFVLEHIDTKVDSLLADAEKAIEKKRYHEAVAALERLSSKAFKGLEKADAAAKKLKELKKDKEVKKELKAWAALEIVMKANESAKSDAARVDNLADFARKNEDTAAAADALKMIQEYADKPQE